jgi:hypothetical protein
MDFADILTDEITDNNDLHSEGQENNADNWTYGAWRI